MLIKCFKGHYIDNERQVNDFIKQIYEDGGKVIDIKVSIQDDISFATVIYEENNGFKLFKKWS